MAFVALALLATMTGVGDAQEAATREGLTHSVEPWSDSTVVCSALAAGEPAHRLDLARLAGNGRWRVFVESSVDTILAIVDDQNRLHCSDDRYGHHPSLEVAPGKMAVFVAAVGAHAYRLTATSDPQHVPEGAMRPDAYRICTGRGCVDPRLRPNLPCPGASTCSVGGTDYIRSITAGGGDTPLAVEDLGLRDARSGQTCALGHVTRSPDLTLYLGEPESRGAKLSIRAEGLSNVTDPTLLVLTASGEWRCSDDYDGDRHPQVDVDPSGPGDYFVWVGTYDGSSGMPVQVQVRRRPR